MFEIILNHWVDIIFTLLTTGTLYILKEYNGLKNGVKALLRNEIVRIYETYSQLGYCPSYMKENVNLIYDNYHKLKGNGMATSMVSKIYMLPNEIREEKYIYEKDIK